MTKQFRPFLSIGIVAAAAVGFSYCYEPLLDQYALATYHPSAEVASIEQKLELTPRAQAIFARANPVIDDKAQFNRDCATVKGELELGCYYDSRIYILQISNDSLAPEMETVMAHEVLHAAWARLGTVQQSALSPQLESAYHALKNSDLNDRMANYAKTEPGQEVNELHSILGTEFSSLPPVLIQHYSQYFINRSAITDAHAKYQSVFTARRDQLASQLATIRTLKAQLTEINTQLDAYQKAGDIASYNRLVPKQNHLVDSVNTDISTYQTGVDEYNALSQSLDSQTITDTETSVQ